MLTWRARISGTSEEVKGRMMMSLWAAMGIASDLKPQGLRAYPGMGHL